MQWSALIRKKIFAVEAWKVIWTGKHDFHIAHRNFTATRVAKMPNSQQLQVSPESKKSVQTPNKFERGIQCVIAIVGILLTFNLSWFVIGGSTWYAEREARRKVMRKLREECRCNRNEDMLIPRSHPNCDAIKEHVALNKIPPWYFMVMGPSGTGKTTFIQSVLKGKKGVLFVEMGQGDVYAQIFEQSGVSPEFQQKLGDKMLFFAEVFAQAQEENGYPVIMVLRARCHKKENENEVLEVRPIAKRFAIDERVCKVVVDVSPHAGKLVHDEWLQVELPFPEKFSEEEFRALVSKYDDWKSKVDEAFRDIYYPCRGVPKATVARLAGMAPKAKAEKTVNMK